MYCKLHDIFWDYKDSWYCPICLIEYSQRLENKLIAFVGENKEEEDE